MTIIQYPRAPKIYINSLVKNAETYFPDKIEHLGLKLERIDAKIIDASFTYSDGEIFVEQNIVDGFYDYFINKKYLKIENKDDQQLFERYSSVVLHLRIMDVKSGRSVPIQLADTDSILDHMSETVLENNKDESCIRTAKKGNNLIEGCYIRDVNSCIPMIGRPIVAYKQKMNGREIPGFSKKYDSILNENQQCTKTNQK